MVLTDKSGKFVVKNSYATLLGRKDMVFPWKVLQSVGPPMRAPFRVEAFRAKILMLITLGNNE